MGSYDTVHNLTADTRIVCAHGHHLVQEFQTKNLGCALHGYYLANGIFCAAEAAPEEYVVTSPDRLVLRTDQVLLPVLDAKTFTLYASCAQCAPVYTRAERMDYGRGFLRPRYPWVSLALTTERGTGRVLTVTPDEAQQTRAMLRAQLAAGGSALVADDDPEVLAALAAEK